VCNVDPLLVEVCLPGTAGGSTRVAVEPTPLGYAPDGTLDNEASGRLRQWWVQRAAWEANCGKATVAECTAALMLGGETGIGERDQGLGVVRIVGAMFPDPNFAPNAARDMRFGLQDYALSFSAWQVFLNLVDYERPAPPPTPDMRVSNITVTSKVQPNTARITAVIANTGTAAAPASVTRFVLDGTRVLGEIATPTIPAGATVNVSVLWNTKGVKGQHAIYVTSDARDAIEELSETNNVGKLIVKVSSNKVTRVTFSATP
jgi:hypothetical protein